MNEIYYNKPTDHGVGGCSKWQLAIKFDHKVVFIAPVPVTLKTHTHTATMPITLLTPNRHGGHRHTHATYDN